jgi:uncharacterized protein Usg
MIGLEGFVRDDGRAAPESELRRQLDGWRLTTAEITYRLPDHPSMLQTYLWQQLDLAPKYPELRKFLDFWTHNIDGKLHSVRVAAAEIVTPGKWRNAAMELRLH